MVHQCADEKSCKIFVGTNRVSVSIRDNTFCCYGNPRVMWTIFDCVLVLFFFVLISLTTFSANNKKYHGAYFAPEHSTKCTAWYLPFFKDQYKHTYCFKGNTDMLIADITDIWPKYHKAPIDKTKFLWSYRSLRNQIFVVLFELK